MPPSRWRRRSRALIKFYRTGETADREAYDIAWVQDKASPVDTINGFIEVYLDARGIKGAWEGLVFYVNTEKTSEIRKLAAERAVVRGPHAVGPEVPEAGRQGHHRQRHRRRHRDGRLGPGHAGRHQPAERPGVREQYGSKSVSLSNVNEAYDKSTLPEFRSEFSWTPEEAARARSGARWPAS